MLTTLIRRETPRQPDDVPIRRSDLHYIVACCRQYSRAS